jgi:hypothetical protein
MLAQGGLASRCNCFKRDFCSRKPASGDFAVVAPFLQRTRRASVTPHRFT